MTDYAVRLPDVGEGVAEAELVEWLVRVGDRITTESVLAEVLTDKATVEISSPVAGVVVQLHGEPGERLAVGSAIVGVRLDPTGDAPPAPPTDVPAGEVAPGAPPAPLPLPLAAPEVPVPVPVAAVNGPADPGAPPSARPLAAAAVRQRAHELRIDLRTVTGTGPEGRVLHADLDRILTGGTRPTAAASESPRVEDVRGVRRRIAERLTRAWTEIPHITYVEAIDVTELEALRAELNRRRGPDAARLSILPFVARALVVACGEQPRLNAWYDAANNKLSVFDSVHIGIATQTPNGLLVPVVHHAEALDIAALAAEIGRLATAARDGSAKLAELTGSTITITSLGAAGGIATTPIINQPEVAIVGVNKLEIRPLWRDGSFVPRMMFNLSSSFDHRIVDGWDAATFIQRVKASLEHPALLFMGR